MPKRRSTASRRRTPIVLGALAALALLVFAGGELFAFLASDLGRVMLWRHLHLGERARVVRIVGRRIHQGLDAARVPRDRVHEEVAPGGEGGTPHWRVELPADGAPLQVNYAITRAVEQGGGEVLSGRERPGADGAQVVTLEVGVPGRPTHVVDIVRPARSSAPEREPARTRVALIVFGLSEDPALALALLARREPIALAVPAAGEGHETLAREAKASGHERVLQIPMEPEDYPRQSPGPGTLLVSMNERRIGSLTRQYLEQAGDVVAVMNLMGAFATQDEPFMTAFYRELRRARVPFLHVAPVARAVCRPLASKLGVAYDEPDLWLDREARADTKAALQRAWRAGLERASARGQAIVALRLTKTSARWLDETLAPRALEGVTLVPLSTLIHHPAGP
jgi:polysaccharide deacetylase 2 family uncharacterized protein YibQ